MKQNIALILRSVLWFCVAALASISCSSETSHIQAASETPDNEGENYKKEYQPPIVRPPNMGIYYTTHKSDEPLRLEAGSTTDLQVTNADRGFGFTQPVGKIITDTLKTLTVWSRAMNLRNIQITRYDGAAILSENWLDEPSVENIAWIPSVSLPVVKNETEIEDAIIQVELEKPLRPGFYILHDDSFLRARQKNEVTAYYPFIVSGENNTRHVWTTSAESCFKRIFAQYEQALPEGQSQYKALRGCAERHHLALKLTTENEAKQKFQKQLLFLSSLANPAMTEVRNRLYEQMAPKGDALTIWFWKKSHADALERLKKIASCLRRGMAYDEILPGLYSYYLGTLMPPVTDLEAFIWIPFTYLEPDSDLLKRLYHSILAGNEDWKLLLVQILGAIEVTRLLKTDTPETSLKTWIASMTQDGMRDFAEIHEEIRLLEKPQTIAVGPFSYHGLTEEEQTEIEQKARQYDSQLTECYHNFERRIGKRASSFILEIALDNQVIGRNLPVVFKDPFEAHRRLPATDQAFVQCARRVLSDLALRPSLNPDKSVQIMISTSNQKISPWLK